MVETARAKQRSARFIIRAADDQMLRALARYHYLTAQQVCRLLYAPGSLTYVMQHLKHLAERKCVQRLFLPRTSQHGSAPSVYTLARKGLNYLTAQGVEVQTWFRPSEELTHSYLFLVHTLAVNDVLIAAELLCRSVPHLTLAHMLHERVLKRQPVHVTLKDGTPVAVIPDGWLDFHVAERYQICLALELDRGTVEQKKWRRKVAGLLAWANGPYQEAFGTSALTIAVVATPGQQRHAELLRWTETELTKLGEEHQADLFRFTHLLPHGASPQQFFLAPVWYQPFAPTPVPLLPLKEADGP